MPRCSGKSQVACDGRKTGAASARGSTVDAAAAEALAVMDGLQLQYLLDDDADTYLARFAAYIDRLVVSLSA